MFKIGDFSKLTFVSIRMLRYYDEIGLFKPVKIDTFTNYRYYSATQIPLLNLIVRLRDMGLKAEEIRFIIQENEKEKQLQLLEKKKLELSLQIHDDELRLQQLTTFITKYNKEETIMKFEAVIKDIPSCTVLALNAVIPAYNQEGELWGKFMELVGKQNLYANLKQGGYCYAMFFEEEHKEGEIHIEIGDEVTGLTKAVEGLEVKELPSVNQALTVLVKGPYEVNIQEGFNFAAKWMEENDYEFRGPSRTAYIKGPGECKDPADYVTEIQIPITKRG